MTRTRRSHVARLSGIALGLAALAISAQAQTSPWYVGLQQRFEHQSNVLQSPVEISDTISSTSLIAGLDQPIGRQRLFGSVTLGRVNYSDQKSLSHDGHSLQLGINWEMAGNLSGVLAVDSAQSLADFTPAGFQSVTSNNLVKTQGGRFSVRLGTVGRLSVEAGGNTRRTRYDNPAYITRNANIDEGFAGLRYRPGGSLVLGAAVRMTRGEYPNCRNPRPGVYTTEGFEKDNLDLTAEWPLSGASRLDARVSIGKDRYDTISTRDFSGVTGQVTWNWQPTGRTSLVTSFSRNSGDDASIALGTGGVPIATAASRVTNVLAARATYDLTGKIKLAGGFSYSDGTSVSLIGGGTTADVNTVANLGLTWQATRAIRAGCDVSLRSRATKAGVTGYDSTTLGCFGEFVLR